MSTRSTIEIRYTANADKENGYGDSFYKHHDGYIKGGLGELLQHFVAYADSHDWGKFKSSFLSFARENKVNSVADYLDEIEKLDNVESFKDRGDTEYHYTIMPSMKGWVLTVQERDFEDERQNLEDVHWTDFAKRKTIGRKGLLFSSNWPHEGPYKEE